MKYPDFRPLHLSDGAPRNFHLFCGKFRMGPSTGYIAERKGCKIKKKNRKCVALKVRFPLYHVFKLSHGLETSKTYILDRNHLISRFVLGLNKN